MATMEPRIQYAQAKDGVSIAFWTLGEGMPFVIMPPFPLSHIEREWQVPEYRSWYELMAKRRKLVRYDGRGLGLSERDVSDFSLDAHLLDLEAIAERLRPERFALFAPFNSGPMAIAYAARYPERVSHLILWCARPRFWDPSYGEERSDWERLFIETDWELYTETMVHQLVGWSAGELGHRMAELLRASVSRERMQEFMTAYPGLDATALLPEVRSPTLVVHRRQVPYPSADVARELASQIPDARLVVLEGASIAPFVDDTQSVLRIIDDFLGLEIEEVTEPVPGRSSDTGGLVTILFTDMEGSSTLTQRLGDAKAQEFLHTHNRVVRQALKAHGGSEIKHTGDGIMASFPSATQALECAIDVQRTFAQHNESAEVPVRVRIGLNAGEPIAEEKDLFGTAVQLAARICSQADPERILVSDVVRQLVAGKGFLFADRGDVALRGFEDPVRLYEVRW